MKAVSICTAKTVIIVVVLSTVIGFFLSSITLAAERVGIDQLDKNTEYNQLFISGAKQTQLIELYSSQGCSSCPPAQRWVNSFTHRKGLWTEFIPVVFHVDYWDDLGWKDPFSSNRHTKRQRDFYSIDAINAVYTPEFIVNGKEWRGWFTGNSLSTNTNEITTGNIGVLSVSTNSDKIMVSFQPQYKPLSDPLYVNIALIGLHLVTDVKHGENASKQLHESFVVLAYKRAKFRSGSAYKWPKSKVLRANKDENLGLVVWLTQGDKMSPVQATGGLLQQHQAKQDKPSIERHKLK